MLRKIIVIFLVASLISGLTGCETLRRKFTRKRKAKPVRPMFYREGESEMTRPPLELYMMHYVYWKTWMDDLINNAGVNKKRDKRASNEAIGNLLDMRKRLTEEKQKELDEYIDEVRRITDKIQTGILNEARLGRLKQELDKVKSRVVRKFYYKKVREHIKQD